MRKEFVNLKAMDSKSADVHADVHADVEVRSKTVIVTGGNCGIGLETAAALAGRGASVILACRSIERGKEAVRIIHGRHPESDVKMMQLDLRSQPSIRRFATSFKELKTPLHLLVNNAGADVRKGLLTEEGVGESAQVNFLGAYILTRLLRAELVAGRPSKVVNVTSVLHRFGSISSGKEFLSDPAKGTYPNCKLANVLFTAELNKRWAKDGIESSAVDPGAVNSQIWRNKPFTYPPLKWLSNLYAPPEDGATAVIHAATIANRLGRDCVLDTCRPDKEEEEEEEEEENRQSHQPCVRLFARGAFSSNLVTSPPCSWLTHVTVLPAVVFAAILIDWPVRSISGKRLFNKVYEVKASPSAYDSNLASRLWEEAADVAGLPRNDDV